MTQRIDSALKTHIAQKSRQNMMMWSGQTENY